MKKIIAPMLGLLAISCAAGMINNPIKSNAEANANGWDYESYETTSNPSDSFFTNCWNQLTYSMRLSEKAGLFTLHPAYGTRGRHKSKFDLSTFEFTIEMSHMSNLVLLNFGKTEGVYFSEAAMIASMDILPAKKNTINGTNNSYMITLSTTINGHNFSIDGFNDGTDWPDDNNFKGISLVAPDNKIHVKFDRVSETSTDVTVNDRVFTVNNSDLYKNLESSGLAYNTPSYVMVGGMNGSGYEKMIFEQFTDAAHEEYYSATGLYTVTKNTISELKAASIEADADAKNFLTKYNTLKFSSLESYDQAYLKADYNAVTKKYKEAVNKVPTFVLTQKTEELKVAYTKVETKDDITKVENAISAVNKEIEGLDPTTLSEALKADYDNALKEVENAKNAISPVAVSIYKETVKAYVDAVDAIKDFDTLIAAKAALVDIPTSYSKYFTDEELAVEVEKINATNAKYEGLVRLNTSNVTQGKYADVLKLEDNSLAVLASGSAQYGNKAVSSGLYFEKPVAYSNFSVTFNVSKLEQDNTWFTLGIMEQPDMFIIAEDSSVTNNKGVSFRIFRDTLTTLSVESYVTTMTATRYYDAKLLATMTIPFAEDVTLKMKSTTKNLGGINENYYVISFNGVELNETIKTTKMKTVFPDGDNAYLYFGSHGSQVAYTIKNINGKDPLSDDLKPASSAPTTTDSEFEYVLGSEKDLAINLDTKGEAISSIKIGKKVVSTANYTYENNVLTIKAAAFAKLAEGEETLTVETAFGSVSWKIVIKTSGGSGEEPVGPDQPSEDKGGCGGSIIATSAIVSTLALAGAGLLIFKKKEEK